MSIIVTNKDFPKASEYIYNKYFKSFDEITNNSNERGNIV